MRAKNQFVCNRLKKVKEQVRSTSWPEKQKISAFSSSQKYFRKVSLLAPINFFLHYFSPKSTVGCKSAFQLARRTGLKG
uniref:Uncharacterized protein n=1 Tax=Gossypium raimondii TaxID=29730 RepID=A0A0D2TZK4_GOSRA|nr:hypothetical protein B456_008G084900 [Gossypium raimondii]